MARDVHENSLDEDTRRFVPDEIFETEQAARNAIEELMKQYQHMDGPLVYPGEGNRESGIRVHGKSGRISPSDVN